MQQVNENLVVISPGEQAPGDCLKIYLSGSLDMSGKGTPWQQKFINGLSKLTVQHPDSPDIPDFSMFKFAVINPLGPANGEPTLDNPEYVQKIQWCLQNQQEADVIFCNFLKKSTMMSAVQDFLVWSQSGKVVVRIPEESTFYPIVSTLSGTFGVPIIGGSGSVIDVMNTIFGSIPKFQELKQYGI